MIKRQLYEKLKDKLGEYLFGFDEHQLDVGFFGGGVNLKDLIFRPKKINENYQLDDEYDITSNMPVCKAITPPPFKTSFLV